MFLSFFTFYPLPRGKYTSMYNYKFLLLISNTVIHIMNYFPCFPLVQRAAGSVFAAFDQTDASITYKINHFALRSAKARSALIWDFHCSDLDLGFPVKGRVQNVCPWFTYSLFYFYSSVFPEPFIKLTQVEPEAGTITFSCNGAVKVKQKVDGGKCMRLSLLMWKTSTAVLSH